jgi:hypothetical protein
MLRPRRLSIALLAVTSLACSKPIEDAPVETGPTASASSENPNTSNEADATKDAATQPNTPPPEPKTPSAATVVAQPQAPVVVEPNTLGVTPVVPVDASAPWREAATPSESITFVNLIGGVLGQSSTGYYAIDDAGQLTLRPEIEKPTAPLIGYWPDNVWYVEIRVKSEFPPMVEDDRGEEDPNELRLMRLRDGSRWVPQEYQGEQRWEENGEDFRIGNKGGLLVADEHGTFTRVAGGAEDPSAGTYRGYLVEWVETGSGKIYPISKDTERVLVQRDCTDQACSDQNTITLPFGKAWVFPLQVPRQRNSVSLAATVTHEGAEKHHVLHYETGGWKLESLRATASGLWPTKDGGLWARVGEQLWHRDPDGGWRNIGLPERATDVSVAMRADQSELWIAATIDGKPVVFATAANVQELPAQPSTVEVQTG